MTQLLPPKKEVALALLERSNVDVYLDPRARGVVVPPQFRKEPRLILKIGLNMPVPIPDLRRRRGEHELHALLQPLAVLLRRPLERASSRWSVRTVAGWSGRTTFPRSSRSKVVEPGDRRRARRAPPLASSASGGRRAPRGTRDRRRDAPPQRAVPSRGAAPARKKKKEEAPRPTLAAVPSRRPDARGRRRGAIQLRRASASPRRLGRSRAREAVSGIGASGSGRAGVTGSARIPPTAPSRPEGARAEARASAALCASSRVASEASVPVDLPRQERVEGIAPPR